MPTNNPPRDTMSMPRVDDDDAFPALQPATPMPADDGFIPVRHSRVAMSFATATKKGMVITHQAMAQQSATSAKGKAAQLAQNRTVTGRPRIAPASAKPAPSGATTEVTVIRERGLDDVTAENALHKRHPGDIVREARSRAAQFMKHCPNILMGRWSTTHKTTGNFVYVLAGKVSMAVIGSLNNVLCDPLGGKGWVVPASSWQWAQLRGVWVKDDDNVAWSNHSLEMELHANPVFKTATLCVPPYWQIPPERMRGDTATVLFAYIDEDMSLTQRAMNEGICMFGAQVKFVPSGDKPGLIQCGRCHLIGHHKNSKLCKVPKDQVRCAKCNQSHDTREHDSECPGPHKVLGKCDCRLKCLLCKKVGHDAHSRKCEKRGDFAAPSLATAAPAADAQPQPPIPRILKKGTAPTANCFNDPKTSRESCTCCPFPVTPPSAAPVATNADPSGSNPTVNPQPPKRKARPAWKGKGKAREGEAYSTAQIAELDQLTADQQRAFMDAPGLPDFQDMSKDEADQFNAEDDELFQRHQTETASGLPDYLSMTNEEKNKFINNDEETLCRLANNPDVGTKPQVGGWGETVEEHAEMIKARTAAFGPSPLDDPYA